MKPDSGGRDHLVLNTRVLSLRVFADKYRVDIIIGSLVPFDRDARSDICKQVEGSAQSQVQGNVALSDFLSLNKGTSQRSVDILGVAKGPVDSFSHCDNCKNSGADLSMQQCSF